MPRFANLPVTLWRRRPGLNRRWRFADRAEFANLLTRLLEQHQQSRYYAQRTANIAEAYDGLRRVTTSLYGVAQINQLQRSRFCIQLLTNCDTTGGPSFTASAGMSVSFGRLAVLAETNTAGRFTGRRQSSGF
jgi:hypothetical protein